MHGVKRGLGAAALLIGFAVGSVPAYATVTYLYTGNPFTTIINGPPPGSRLTGAVTFVGALAPSTTYGAADVLDFSYNDGALTITKGNERPGNEFFAFTTDAAGGIAFWNVQMAYQFPLTLEVIRFRSLNEPNLVPFDDTQAVANGNYLGQAFNNPGVWTLAAVAVPEPSTMALLGMGVLFVGVARARGHR